MSIVSTISCGRTHIANGTNYLGSINSYQHWLTKLVARILGLAICVSFNGKERLVNKKSYSKFLNSFGNADIDLQNYQTFDKIPHDSTEIPSRNIREYLSSQKRRKLFKKLAKAIFEGNQEQAVKTIYKGADLCGSYHQIGGRALSFAQDFSQELNPDRVYTFQVLTGTPLIHAQVKSLNNVVEALIHAGAFKGERGVAYQWKRQIIGIDRHSSWDIFPALGIFPGLFLGLVFGRREKAKPIFVIKTKNREEILLSDSSD